MPEMARHVSGDRPEPTLENIPDDVVKAALSIAVTYQACPYCGEEQFLPVVAGRNTYHDCRACGDEMSVVG